MGFRFKTKSTTGIPEEHNLLYLYYIVYRTHIKPGISSLESIDSAGLKIVETRDTALISRVNLVKKTKQTSKQTKKKKKRNHINFHTFFQIELKKSILYIPFSFCFLFFYSLFAQDNFGNIQGLLK